MPAQPDLDAIRELEALRQAFQAAPGNRHFRFQHLFLNVVDHPAARVRPQGDPIESLQILPAQRLMHAITCLPVPQDLALCTIAGRLHQRIQIKTLKCDLKPMYCMTWDMVA